MSEQIGEMLVSDLNLANIQVERFGGEMSLNSIIMAKALILSLAMKLNKAEKAVMENQKPPQNTETA